MTAHWGLLVAGEVLFGRVLFGVFYKKPKLKQKRKQEKLDTENKYLNLKSYLYLKVFIRRLKKNINNKTRVLSF